VIGKFEENARRAADLVYARSAGWQAGSRAEPVDLRTAGS
jgi:hypothetical protein